jgi:hypothetical protein
MTTTATTTSKHFEISQLPSLKQGMTVEQERQMRIKTCRFIEEAAARTSLKFHRVAVSTAMVFFHRFYAKHAFQDHDRFEVAVAAILLAGKTEETPKKLVTVIQECYRVKVRGMQAGRISTHGGTPIPTSSTLDPKSTEYTKLKDRVLLMEVSTMVLLAYYRPVLSCHSCLVYSCLFYSVSFFIRLDLS